MARSGGMKPYKTKHFTFETTLKPETLVSSTDGVCKDCSTGSGFIYLGCF